MRSDGMLFVAADVADRSRVAVSSITPRLMLAFWLVLATPTGVMTWPSVGAAQTPTKEAPYKNEGAARECVHKRLAELVAQNQPNIAGDTGLAECSKGLQLEFKERRKSYCEAVSYIGWLVADENSKLNGLKGEPYRPDKASIQRCDKSNTWEKHS